MFGDGLGFVHFQNSLSTYGLPNLLEMGVNYKNWKKMNLKGPHMFGDGFFFSFSK
jgi:hypothetical protein